MRIILLGAALALVACGGKETADGNAPPQGSAAAPSDAGTIDAASGDIDPATLESIPVLLDLDGCAPLSPLECKNGATVTVCSAGLQPFVGCDFPSALNCDAGEYAFCCGGYDAGTMGPLGRPGIFSGAWCR